MIFICILQFKHLLWRYLLVYRWYIGVTLSLAGYTHVEVVDFLRLGGSCAICFRTDEFSHYSSSPPESAGGNWKWELFSASLVSSLRLTHTHTHLHCIESLNWMFPLKTLTGISQKGLSCDFMAPPPGHQQMRWIIGFTNVFSYSTILGKAEHIL